MLHQVTVAPVTGAGGESASHPSQHSTLTAGAGRRTGSRSHPPDSATAEAADASEASEPWASAWLTTATHWVVDKATPTAWEVESAPDVAYQRLAIVNVVYVGARNAGDLGWVLVDTGVAGFSTMIVRTAARRFGPGARPRGIVLTHSHFDHAGNLLALLDAWGHDIPVYAHEEEMPFLDGRESYPPAKTDVGGGLVARASFAFPRGPYRVPPNVLRALPRDGSVPCLGDEWRWVHTPGHTPGHVSLFRASDRTLIVGDAFCTTQQESAYAVATQAVKVSGPPAYFTPDPARATASVRALARLEPRLVVPGHGRALQGDVSGALAAAGLSS